jgi:sigma-B regulation protein RsbU (phosphoserine phosphatase)
MAKINVGGPYPRYYWVVVFIAAVLIFAQGYYVYHRSLGPTDGVTWTVAGRVETVEPGGPAEKAGFRVGDKIVALDDVSEPEALRRKLVAISDAYHVGDRHHAIVERDGQRLRLEYQVESNYRDWLHLLALMFGNLVALAFLATGLGVFFLKPRDRQVLLFCLAFVAISTFFGNILPVYLRRLPLGTGHLIWFVQTMLSIFALPLTLHFFLTFPSPVGLVKRWPRLMPVIYIPSILFLPVAIIGSLPPMYNFDLSPWLRESLRSLDFSWYIRLVAIVYFVAGIIALAVNYRAAVSPDHRRRVRVLMVGTIVGFGPLVALTGLGRRALLFTHEWEAAVGFLVLFAPLSVAYAIIKHRLFDLRLVIRRSLQYALARHVLFAVLISPMALLIIDLIASHGNFIRHQLQEEYPRIGLYLLAGALLISVHRPLMSWLDRKFFREAYDARKILSELAEKIGLMVNTQELMSMVMGEIDKSLHIKCGALLLCDPGSDFFCSHHTIGHHPCPISIPVESRLVAELEKSRAWPLEVHSDEAVAGLRELPPADRQLLREAGINLIVPLRLSNKVIGMMLLGEKQSEEPYSKEDKELLMTVAAQTALGIERARLSSEMAEEEKLKREMEIAQEVQAQLFPQSVPRLATLDVAGVCRPAQGVGGDYYDFLPLAPGRLGVAIGDISGKGISAALLMANLQASLRSQAAVAGNNVAQLMSQVNSLLFRSTSINKYATLFYAAYDEVTQALTYVNAGHNAPLLVRSPSLRRPEGIARMIRPVASGNLALVPEVENGASICRLETGGTIIGAFEASIFQQETLHLEPGDVLVAYTDGVIEAHSSQGEAFGEERLEQLVLDNHAASARDLVHRIVETVSDFTRGTHQHDDMTLVVLKIV